MNIEQLDELVAYLLSCGHIEPSEEVRCTPLWGGVSNRTVLVERPNGEAWVLKQALHKLRVDVDWFSDPRRVHREALGLRWIGQLTDGATPALIFEDRSHHLLAMQAIPRPHYNWKQLLLSGRLQESHVVQFARLLATIHREAYARRDELEALFSDRSYFDALRLEPYYRYSAQQEPSAAALLHGIIDQTRAERITLVHGDYSPKNVLVHQGRLVLLDHEVIHFGDPAFDIGFSLTHFLSKANHMPSERDAFKAATKKYWKVYRGEVEHLDWAADLEERAVRHTLACLLARVVGRSRLEYLDMDAQRRQREASLALMADAPDYLDEFIDDYIQRL